MSILDTPRVAAVAARVMQGAVSIAGIAVNRRARRFFPEFPGTTSEVMIPTSVAAARAVVYRPAGSDERQPVHVNFHGGGYVLRGVRFDDPLCRYLAAETGVVVVNVDYVVAPQHRFPASPHQAYEVTRWIAEHGAEHGWDGDRLTVGGQSAGGGLAAAVARQALEQGTPPIALQVLHYPPLDLTTNPKGKPWMGKVFDGVYVPDLATRGDRLLSPAGPADTADLTGIAPALVITCEFDGLRDEGQRYAQRLEKAGALVAYHDVAQADHAYDMRDVDKARQTYDLIARYIKQASR